MLKPLIRILIVAALVPFTGCSLLMRTESPRYRPEHGEPSCSGAFLPVVDTGAAVGMGLAAASILADEPEQQECTDPFSCTVFAPIGAAAETARVMAGVTALAIAAIYTVSALHGYKNASRCNDAWEDRHAWERGNPRAMEEAFVPQLPASGLGSACQAHEQCGSGNGCDPTTHQCVELP